jgi:hypothetical protein
MMNEVCVKSRGKCASGVIKIHISANCSCTVAEHLSTGHTLSLSCVHTYIVTAPATP